MPPKPKCTKEELIEAGFSLVKENGSDALVARAVGKKIGTTTTPIFTFFDSMDELKDAVAKKAQQYWFDYLGEALKSENPFKEFGRRYIMFAMEEPNLYKMLSENGYVRMVGEDDQDPKFAEVVNMITDSICSQYQYSEEEALWLFEHMNTYTMGFVMGIVNNKNMYSPELIVKKQMEASMSFQFYLDILKDRLDVKKAQGMQKGSVKAKS